jgi:hypothetical protein
MFLGRDVLLVVLLLWDPMSERDTGIILLVSIVMYLVGLTYFQILRTTDVLSRSTTPRAITQRSEWFISSPLDDYSLSEEPLSSVSCYSLAFAMSPCSLESDKTPSRVNPLTVLSILQEVNVSSV